MRSDSAVLYTTRLTSLGSEGFDWSDRAHGLASWKYLFVFFDIPVSNPVPFLTRVEVFHPSLKEVALPQK